MSESRPRHANRESDVATSTDETDAAAEARVPEDWSVTLTGQQSRAVARITEPLFGSGPAAVASATTRTAPAIRKRFWNAVGIYVLAMFGIYVVIVMIGTSAGGARGDEFASIGALVIGGITAGAGLIIVPMLWFIYGAPSKNAPNPPLSLEADAEGLRVRQGAAAYAEGPWSQWFPARFEIFSTKAGPSLYGLYLVPLEADGRACLDRTIRVSDPTMAGGGALLGACLKGLLASGRLQHPG